MKRLNIIAAALVFGVLLSGAVIAQTGGAAQPPVKPALTPVPTKIGWIITEWFGDEKEGITKFVAAEKSLDAELKPRLTELQTMQTRMQTLSEEIKKLTANPSVPVPPATIAAKQDEGQKLQREYEFKQKEAQAAYAKRREEVMTPIQNAIFTALQEYARAKGYSVVIDVSAMNSQQNAPNPVLVLDQSANITKDFITFYNTKPATTATTATPRP